MTIPSTNPLPEDDGLSTAERQLLDAAVTGALVDLRTGNADLDNPTEATTWSADRTVQARLLADLLTGERALEQGLVRAVKLRGARITGPLDLEARTLLCPLLLHDCQIEQPVNLSEATAPAVRLPGCHLPAFMGRQLRTVGDLVLAYGFTVSGGVHLPGARIGGELNLNGANLTNQQGRALDADGLTVERNMLCKDGFTANGEVRLLGAHIVGQLEMSGASMTNEHGEAFNGDGLTVEQDMFCRGGFTTHGGFRLLGARIGGQLDLKGASLANEEGSALDADGLTVTQDMFCGEGFTAHGEVRLPGARIGGQLDMDGASLANDRGMALYADGLTVEQDMACGNGFTARGEVRFLRARIGVLDMGGASLANDYGRALYADGLAVGQDMLCSDGFTARGEVRIVGASVGWQLDLSGASLVNDHGPALQAATLTVGQGMFCRETFTARGEVCLLGGRVGGELDLSGASLVNDQGRALYADSLTVKQGMYCGKGFTARGEIGLAGAHIGGELDLSGASLNGGGGPALNLYGARVATLLLLPGRSEGPVELANAKVGAFHDDPENWPTAVSLRGFVYDTVENTELGVRERLRWLARDPGGYSPQVYNQLASAYRRSGQEDAARKVAVAKQWRRRSAANPLNWLMYATVGYGYRNWLAGAWLAVLVALGTWVFSRAYPAHMIAIRSRPPAFHAVAYAFDLLLPVISLGQKSAWQPEGSAVLYWSWALTVAGWVLTTAVVAGLTGVLKRD
jgi:hypothetical protein